MSAETSSVSFGKRVSWRLEALAYDIVSFTLNLFPFSWVSATGGALLRLIGPLTSKHKIARKGLVIAFPEKSETEIRALLKAQWENTGRTFAEFPLMHRIKAFDHELIEIRGLKHFEANTPAVIVTGHFANWEVMATVLTQSAKPVRITYRKINNPHIDKRVRKQREAYGTKFLVQKSTHKGGRQLYSALRIGESIAILNDQKFNTGLPIPFFGTEAMTAQGATRLALKTERPLLPMAVTRSKTKFTVTFYPPIEFDRDAEREDAVLDGVTKITRFIEDRVKDNPDQWFWVHRRWPKEYYN